MVETQKYNLVPCITNTTYIKRSAIEAWNNCNRMKSSVTWTLKNQGAHQNIWLESMMVSLRILGVFNAHAICGFNVDVTCETCNLTWGKDVILVVVTQFLVKMLFFFSYQIDYWDLKILISILDVFLIVGSTW